MLSKKYRLPIQEFLLKRAQIKRSPYFTVKIFDTALPYSRFGVIISKKIAPKATTRNRLKRLIFSRCYPTSGTPKAGKPPRDVLIIVQKSAIIDELSWVKSSILF